MILSDKYPNIVFSLIYKVHSWDLYRSLFSDFGLMMNIIKVASVITIVTILETIVSGKIAEKKTKQKFSKNREVLGNALANI